MFSRYLFCLAGAFALVATALHAQPTFRAADFDAVQGRARTRALYGAANPEALAAALAQTGGPHVFSLMDALLGPPSVQTLVPASCAPSTPGCALAAFAAANRVTLLHEGAAELYLYQHLNADALDSYGSAGQAAPEAPVGSIENTRGDRVLAFPLEMGQQWTSRFGQSFRAGEERLALQDVVVERAVVAWGTARTAVAEAEGVVVRETRITTVQDGAGARPDTAVALRFVSPRLVIVARLSPAGTAESVTFEVTEGGAATDAAAPETPAAAGLAQPYPNPARGSVRVPFTLAHAGAVTLDVFDALGRQVARLENGLLPAGAHTRAWSCAGASGLYVVRLVAGGAQHTAALACVE